MACGRWWARSVGAWPRASGAETKWLGEKDFMGFCNICGDLLEFQ